MRRTISLLCTVLFISTLALAIAGCNKDTRKINSLKLISATGNSENSNCLFLSEFATSFMDVTLYDKTLLESESAAQLINEINNIPDAQNAQGPLAFKIEIIYTDNSSSVHEVKKEGYGSFPSNWSTVISLVNTVAQGQANISDSTDIVTIDAQFLKENYNVSESMLPQNATFDDLIREVPLTYETIYDPVEGSKFDIEKAISDYIYDYYDMESHKMYDFAPVASTFDELKVYADHRLDSVDTTGNVSISGKYQGYDFDIVKYDEFAAQIQGNEYADLRKKEDNSLEYVFEQTSADGSEVIDSHTKDIYVDSSSRFIILTNCEDYNIIYEMVR